MKKIGIILFIILSFAPQLNAEDYNFTRYSQSEGLPHTIIESIHQDAKGFLWLATWSGISRYDGVSFENYSIPTSDSQLSNFWTSHPISKGTSGLWEATKRYTDLMKIPGQSSQ